MTPERKAIQEKLAAKKSISPERRAIQEKLAARNTATANNAIAAKQINKPLDSAEGYDNTMMLGPFDTGLPISQDSANFYAGIPSGMKSMWQGLGNMVGMVDDETVLNSKNVDHNLSETTAGSVGQFVGETAALAPLGVVAKGFQAAHKVAKLPAAIKAVTGTLGAATVEGGLAGAIAANPNERTEGAILGATTGGILNKAMAGLSRMGKDGLVKLKPSAKKLTKLIKDKTGRDTFIPLGQAADSAADSSSAKGKAYADFVSMLPSARAKMAKQAKGFSDDMYETNLRQVFQKAKGNVGVDEFTKSGDMQRALEAAKNSGKGGFSPTQDILNTAAKGRPLGLYSPKDLVSAAEGSARKAGKDLGYSPMREVGNQMQDVMGDSIGDSNVAARDAYHSLSNAIGFMADAPPGLGAMLASKNVQNFLMGNTGLQLTLKKAMETGDGKAVRSIMSHIRRAMSVQV